MYNFSIFVQKEDKYYVANNLELGIFSQGKTYDEALSNLREATELFIEDENINSLNQKFQNNNYILTNMII